MAVSQAVWYSLARETQRQAGTRWRGSGSKVSSLRFVLGIQEPQRAISKGWALVCQESEKQKRLGGWFRGEESPAEKLGRFGAKRGEAWDSCAM